eukprot:EG_transcript_25323
MLATRLAGRIAARVPRNVVVAFWLAYAELSEEFAEEARKRGTSNTRATTDVISRPDALQVLGINADAAEKLDEKQFIDTVQERWAKMYEINTPDAQTGEGGSPYLQAIITNARNVLVGSVIDPLLAEMEAEGKEADGEKPTDKKGPKEEKK